MRKNFSRIAKDGTPAEPTTPSTRSRNAMMIKQRSAPQSLSNNDADLPSARSQLVKQRSGLKNESSQNKIVMTALSRRRSGSGDDPESVFSQFSQSTPNMNHDGSVDEDESSFDTKSESSWSAMLESSSAKPAPPPSKPNVMVRATRQQPSIQQQQQRATAATNNNTAGATPGKRPKKKIIKASELAKLGIKIDKHTSPQEIEEALKRLKMQQRPASGSNDGSARVRRSNAPHSDDNHSREEKPAHQGHAGAAAPSKKQSSSGNQDFTGLVIGGEKTEVISPVRSIKPRADIDKILGPGDDVMNGGGAEGLSPNNHSQPDRTDPKAPPPDWEYLTTPAKGLKVSQKMTQGLPNAPDMDSIESPRSKPLTTAELRAAAKKAFERSRSHSPGLTNKPANTTGGKMRNRSKSPGIMLKKASRSRTPSGRRGRSRGRRPSGTGGAPISEAAKGRDISKSPSRPDYKPVAWSVDNADTGEKGHFGVEDSGSMDEAEEIQARLEVAGITQHQYKAILAAGLKVSLA